MTWQHDLDPILFSLAGFDVHWYGIMYLAAFAGAWCLGYRRLASRQSHWNRDQLNDLISNAIIGIVVGGRLGYFLLYAPDILLSSPWRILALQDGGMSFHGGLIGVAVALYLFSRQHRVAYLAVTDFLAPLVPLGLGLGRLGNFINGNLWGRPTDGDWGVVFPKAGDLVARHPSQLYQLLLEGVVLFCLVWWYSASDRQKGQVTGVFLVGYGSFRVAVEFFREPDRHLGTILFDTITMGQLLSVPMILLGVMLVRHQGIRGFWFNR